MLDIKLVLEMMVGEKRKPHLAIIPEFFRRFVEISDELFFLFIRELRRSSRSGIAVWCLLNRLFLEPIEPIPDCVTGHIVQLN